MTEPSTPAKHGQHSNLPWLDHLAMAVPGYSGYSRQALRKQAAFALRDAMLRRLAEMRAGLETAKKTCGERDAVREIQSLDRIEQHLDRIIQRIEGLGTRIPDFYEGPDLETRLVMPLHGADLALLRKADHLVEHFEHPQPTHNFLADLEFDLREFEALLDARALMLQGMNNLM